jgi:hypothetical protein
MIVAYIEGNVVFLVVTAIALVINWIYQKSATEKPPGQRPQQAPPPNSQAEEERVRRFMEALGIPFESATPPVLPKRAEFAGQASPLPNIQPGGSVVSGRGAAPAKPRSRPSGQPPAMPPAVPRKPVFVPTPSEGPQLPVEKIQLPELQAPVFGGYDTVSSHVSAIPFEASHADMRDAYVSRSQISASLSEAEVRELLSSPKNLRSAILLREILGPPRGLQS